MLGPLRISVYGSEEREALIVSFYFIYEPIAIGLWLIAIDDVKAESRMSGRWLKFRLQSGIFK